MIRQSLIAALTGAALTGAALLGGTWAGAASTAHPAAAHPAAGGTTFSSESRPGPTASAAPAATGIPLSPAALAAAAGRCAAWASQQGFADNGYLTGSLTAAVAIALAESGCDPSACYDDTTNATCARHVPHGDSVDRGAWQLNSKNQDGVSARCAFSGPCAARSAYRSISLEGTYFARWSTYLTDGYAQFLTAAQVAVNALHAGTVTGGLPGSCLSYPSEVVAAPAVMEACGSGAADEQWTAVGNTLRTSGGLCLAVASRSQPAPVVLSGCNGGPLQRWVAHADAALYNRAARRCLNYPGTVVTAGAVIGDLGCNGMQGQTWFKP
jgi:Lysozyme like domain/Ricin-type beta-trefoil lectin domain